MSRQLNRNPASSSSSSSLPVQSNRISSSDDPNDEFFNFPERINISQPIQNPQISSTTTYTVNQQSNENEILVIDSDSDDSDSENEEVILITDSDSDDQNVEVALARINNNENENDEERIIENNERQNRNEIENIALARDNSVERRVDVNEQENRNNIREMIEEVNQMNRRRFGNGENIENPREIDNNDANDFVRRHNNFHNNLPNRFMPQYD